MKQTQTKLFDFSDIGLDFCSGSKALYPAVFKKILTNGYNPKTALSFSITGSQVTLTFGVNHGYPADRVLLISASGGFNKEVYIDEVTSSTVTCTVLDGDTTGLSGTINTKIASLGWTLVYENGQVQLYKMKYLDGRDLYVRLVFQNTGAVRNTMNICVGKTADESTGVITDSYAFQDNRSNTAVQAGFEWMFDNSPVATYDSYSYAQGLTIYGKGCIIGSKYHIIFLSNNYNPTYSGKILGILPSVTLPYIELDYPLVLGQYSTSAMNVNNSSDWHQFGNVTANSNASSNAYIGKIPIAIDFASNAGLFSTVPSGRVTSSYLPSSLDNFNTSSAQPLALLEKTTKQFLGFTNGGIYRVDNVSGSAPSNTKSESPSDTTDTDFKNKIKMHFVTNTGATNAYVYFAAPIEEIKIA